MSPFMRRECKTLITDGSRWRSGDTELYLCYVGCATQFRTANQTAGQAGTGTNCISRQSVGRRADQRQRNPPPVEDKVADDAFHLRSASYGGQVGSSVPRAKGERYQTSLKCIPLSSALCVTSLIRRRDGKDGADDHKNDGCRHDGNRRTGEVGEQA